MFILFLFSRLFAVYLTNSRLNVDNLCDVLRKRVFRNNSTIIEDTFVRRLLVSGGM